MEYHGDYHNSDCGGDNHYTQAVNARNCCHNKAEEEANPQVWWDLTKHSKNNHSLVLELILHAEYPSAIKGTSRIGFQ